MKLGYARVSTVDQNAQLQMNALAAAGCERTFSEQASGAQRDRPELAALEFARRGDVLVVWKLDRVARSLSQLLATSDMLDQRGVGLLSLTENIDTTTPGDGSYFTYSVRWPSSRGHSSGNGPRRGLRPREPQVDEVVDRRRYRTTDVSPPRRCLLHLV